MIGCHESWATVSSLEAQMRTLPSGAGFFSCDVRPKQESDQLAVR